ncbi:MAG: SDR family oxidoreductase [Chloroflexota bacterium]|nr:SDR family oxidoreductase [Chloroflexota bacterium]
MGDSLKDRVAVVTGSGRGIGRAIVMLMASEGAKVVVNDVGGAIDGSASEERPADETANEIKSKGGEAVANYDSVATPEGGENIIKTAIDNFGKIDILVNNAGILRDRMIHNMSFEDFDAVIKVHLYGTFNCSKPAIVAMRQQNYGRIINFSSIGGGGGGPLANPGQANYTAAKAGIIGISRTIAMEGARKNITCNVIFPAAKTRLGWNPELEAAWDKRKEAGIIDSATVILEKMKSGEMEPENVAPIVAYLASEGAGFITGNCFHTLGKELRLYGEMLPTKTIYTPESWTVDYLAKNMPRLVTMGVSLG